MSATQYRPLMIAVAVISGVLACSFSAIFLNIALPAMIAELNIDNSHSHWLLSAFITTSTLCMLVVSPLISRYSLRNTFISFLLIFISSSMIGASLDQLWLIILCRAAQGSALGVLSVLALIALFDSYPLEKRGHAGAIFGLGVAMGPTLGPTLSGFIVEFWGWRATFYAPLPFALLSLVLSWKVLPSKVIQNTKKFDLTGFILLTLLLFFMLGSISYLKEQQWSIQPLLLVSLVTISLMSLLWRHQKHRADPLLLLSLFKYPAFNAAAIVSFVYGMGVWGSAFFLPLYLQQAVGMSTWETGMVMLPSGLVLFATLPCAGFMTDRFAPRYIVSLGLAAFGISFLLMGFGIAYTSFALMALLIAISRGLGLGIMTPSLDATATRSLPTHSMPEGVAMMNFLRQLGGAFSPTLLMLILQWRLQSNSGLAITEQVVLTSYHETLLALGGLFMCSLFAANKLRTPNNVT